MKMIECVVRGDVDAVQIGVLSAQAVDAVDVAMVARICAFKSGRIDHAMQVFKKVDHDAAPVLGCQAQHEISARPIIGFCEAGILGEGTQTDGVNSRVKQELRRGPVRPQPRPNNLRAARTKK